MEDHSRVPDVVKMGYYHIGRPPAVITFWPRPFSMQPGGITPDYSFGLLQFESNWFGEYSCNGWQGRWRRLPGPEDFAVMCTFKYSDNPEISFYMNIKLKFDKSSSIFKEERKDIICTFDTHKELLKQFTEGIDAMNCCASKFLCEDYVHRCRESAALSDEEKRELYILKRYRR